MLGGGVRKSVSALALAGLLGGMSLSSVMADTVVLANGDRLSGEVLLMDSGTLVLKTDYAGEIRIAWDQVEQIETDDPLLLKAEQLPDGFEGRLVSAQGVGKVGVVAQDGLEPASDVPLEDVQRIVRPNAVLREWSIKGGVDLAMDATHSSNKSQNWNAAANVTMRRDAWRHGLNVNFARNKQDGVVGTYNYDAAYSLDRFVTDKLFVRGRLRYGRDHVDNPARQVIFAAGPGYQFWDNELGALSVYALLRHTRYKYHDNERDRFQSAALGWNYTRYLASKQWQVFTGGEVSRSLKRSSDYSVEADVGLRYNVSDFMSLYAKAGYTRISMTGQDTTNERRYSVGLGVHW